MTAQSGLLEGRVLSTFSRPTSFPRCQVNELAASFNRTLNCDIFDLTFRIGLMERVRVCRLRATLSVNRELVAFYCDIGRSVVER